MDCDSLGLASIEAYRLTVDGPTIDERLQPSTRLPVVQTDVHGKPAGIINRDMAPIRRAARPRPLIKGIAAAEGISVSLGDEITRAVDEMHEERYRPRRFG